MSFKVCAEEQVELLVCIFNWLGAYLTCSSLRLLGSDLLLSGNLRQRRVGCLSRLLWIG